MKRLHPQVEGPAPSGPRASPNVAYDVGPDDMEFVPPLPPVDFI
jgi:hypothetical protein